MILIYNNESYNVLINQKYGKFEATTISKTLWIKIGVGLTLLIWSFSECFNNEKYDRKIWNVSLLL